MRTLARMKELPRRLLIVLCLTGAVAGADELGHRDLSEQLNADELAVRNRAMRRLLGARDPQSIKSLVQVARRSSPEGVDRAVHILQEFSLDEDATLSNAAFDGLREAAAGRPRSPAHVALKEYNNRLLKRLKPRVDELGGSLTVNFNGRVHIALNSDWRGTEKELRLICKLQSIERFSIERSALADDDMRHLAGMHAVNLYFGETQLTAKGLRLLGEMPTVEYLSLRKNRLGGLRPGDLAGFRQLRVLALDDTDVTNEDMRAVAELETLWNLNLQNLKQIDDRGLAYLRPLHATAGISPELQGGGLASLQQLQLTGTSVTGTGFAGGRFPLLTYLAVKRCPLTPEGLREICKLKTLMTLGLDHTTASDDDMPYVAALPALKTLWLSKSQVTDKGLGVLGKVRSLEVVYVHGAEITSVGRRKLQEQLPNCRVEGVKRSNR